MGQRSDDLTGASGGYDENNPLYAYGPRVTASDDEIEGEHPTEIQDDIEDTRARMSTTIDAIQEKLSPSNLMEQAKETARDATIGRAQDMASNVADTARETGSTLMDTVRQNPVPVALAGIGLGWLFLSARRESSRRQQDRAYGYRGYDDRTRGSSSRPMRTYQQSQQSQQSPQDKSRMGQMANQVQDTAGNVSDKVQDAASNVADKAEELGDRAQWQAQQTRSWLEQTWNDNPLVVSGAAVVLGAFVGLSIPETPMEDQLMGETRDNLVQKAQGFAQDTVVKAQQTATNATNQMANQQSQSGKQPDKKR